MPPPDPETGPDHGRRGRPRAPERGSRASRSRHRRRRFRIVRRRIGPRQRTFGGRLARNSIVLHDIVCPQELRRRGRTDPDVRCAWPARPSPGSPWRRAGAGGRAIPLLGVACCHIRRKTAQAFDGNETARAGRCRHGPPPLGSALEQTANKPLATGWRGPISEGPAGHGDGPAARRRRRKRQRRRKDLSGRRACAAETTLAGQGPAREDLRGQDAEG